MTLSNLVDGFLSFITAIMNLILAPIDILIGNYLPSISEALTKINLLFEFISQSLSWVVSISGLSSYALSLIVLYFIFKLTVPLQVYIFKFILKWYRKLVP